LVAGKYEKPEIVLYNVIRMRRTKPETINATFLGSSKLEPRIVEGAEIREEPGFGALVAVRAPLLLSEDKRQLQRIESRMRNIFKTNKTGLLVLRLCDGNTSIEKIADLVAKKFRKKRAVLTDIKEFIGDLTSLGVVRLDEEI